MFTKPWQKNLLRTIAFALVLLVCIALLGRYLMPHSNRYLTGYTAGGILGEDFDTIDVLVLGDSNAAQGIAPMEWYKENGITGYTYGAGWFSAYKAYYRLRQIYEEQSPRVVVLCTGMVYSRKGNRNWFQNAVWDTLGETFPLIRFHDDWKYLTPQNLLEEHDYSWRDVNKGFTPLSDVSPYLGGDYMNDSGAAEIDPGVLLYLGRIRDLCAEHDSELLLITVPAAASWNMARHNGIAAYAKENGLVYLDYNLDTTSLGLDWATDSADAGDHLNYWGAKKLSDGLGAYLAEHYALEDHRGQPAFADWDEDLAAYNTTVAQINERKPS